MLHPSYGVCWAKSQIFTLQSSSSLHFEIIFGLFFRVVWGVPPRRNIFVAFSYCFAIEFVQICATCNIQGVRLNPRSYNCCSISVNKPGARKTNGLIWAGCIFVQFTHRKFKFEIGPLIFVAPGLNRRCKFLFWRARRQSEGTTVTPNSMGLFSLITWNRSLLNAPVNPRQTYLHTLATVHWQARYAPMYKTHMYAAKK